MRVQFLGSNDFFSPSAPASEEPKHAILPFPGTRVQFMPAPDRGIFPQTRTLDEMCERYWRIRKYRAQLDWHVPFTDIDHPEETGSLTLDFISEAPDETALINANSVPLINAFTAGEGTITRDDHTNPPVTVDNPTGGQIQLITATQFPSFGKEATNLDRYYYDSTTDMWMPRIELWIRPLGSIYLVFISNYLQPDQPTAATPGDAITVFPGTFCVADVDWQVRSSNASAPDTFTLDVTPLEWWEYRSQTGDSPIWRSTDGFELQDHKTLEP